MLAPSQTNQEKGEKTQVNKTGDERELLQQTRVILLVLECKLALIALCV